MGNHHLWKSPIWEISWDTLIDPSGGRRKACNGLCRPHNGIPRTWWVLPTRTSGAFRRRSCSVQHLAKVVPQFDSVRGWFITTITRVYAYFGTIVGMGFINQLRSPCWLMISPPWKWVLLQLFDLEIELGIESMDGAPSRWCVRGWKALPLDIQWIIIMVFQERGIPIKLPVSSMEWSFGIYVQPTLLIAGGPHVRIINGMIYMGL